MAWEKRNSVRALISNYTDYDIELTSPDGRQLKGWLGNISNGGLMFLHENAVDDVQTGNSFKGRLEAAIIHEKFSFGARVVWSSSMVFNKRELKAAGLKFDLDTSLPDRIMALALSLE